MTAVYDTLAPAVLGWFRSHRMTDPEALTGDVFVAVARALPTFEGDDDALRRWVFTIARNRRTDAIRAAKRRPVEVRLDETGLRDEPTAPSATDPVDPELVAAIARLTDDQREVVLLRVVADLSVADVAVLTGRSPGSVKMLTSRGLASLRADPLFARTRRS